MYMMSYIQCSWSSCTASNSDSFRNRPYLKELIQCDLGIDNA